MGYDGPMPLLQVEDCVKKFGGLTAVNGFSLALEPGELVGLIGPNGAGKTTAFNLLTGVYRPTSGAITFNGRSVVGLKPYQIAALGISRTFQNIRLFPTLSVLDNIRTAAHLPSETRFRSSAVARRTVPMAEEMNLSDSARMVSTHAA